MFTNQGLIQALPKNSALGVNLTDAMCLHFSSFTPDLWIVLCGH